MHTLAIMVCHSINPMFLISTSSYPFSSPRKLPIKTPPNNNPPNLTRPRPNLIQLRIPQQPPRRHLIHIPHPAHQLNRIKRTLGRPFRRIQNRARAIFRVGPVFGGVVGGVEGGGDAVGVGGGGAVFGVHVCEFGLDELVVGDGGGELGAGVGVGEGEG